MELKRAKKRSIRDAVRKTLITQARNMKSPGTQSLVEFSATFRRLFPDPPSARVFHVAGTKGKGSTCYCIEALLRSETPDDRVGLFTSPHLVDVRERCRLNGDLVAIEAFTDAFWWTYDSINPKERPGYFHFLFLVAWKLFANDAQSLILEVGLGGRLDATNVIESPACCVVTHLDLDHVEILGNTLDEIAFEKAGIAKKNVPLATPSTQRSLDVLARVCKGVGAPLHVIDVNAYAAKLRRIGYVRPHEIENAALALAAVEIGLGLDSSPELPRDLVAHKPAGRLQILHDGQRTWYLDGAHTASSLKIACGWFSEEAKREKDDRPNVLVSYVAHSRDLVNLFRVMSTEIDPSKWSDAYFTSPTVVKPSWVKRPSFEAITSSTSSTPASDESWPTTMARVWKFVTNSPAEGVDDVGNVFDALPSNARVFVTGSFLLVGDALVRLNCLPSSDGSLLTV